MSRLKPVASALALAGLAFGNVAFAQVQRTFVASYGNDANAATNCGFTNPCRGFTAAHAVTTSGGEIVALDAAGYGAITITKSVSIIANPGVYAGISASAGSAVTIATASVNVRLSGLKINGIGASRGVNMTNGSSLTVENCTISGFSLHGVDVSAGAALRVTDSLISNNLGGGVYLRSGAVADIFNTRLLGNLIGVWLDEQVTASTFTIAAVSNSVLSQNSYGGVAQTTVGSSARLSVANSAIDNNGTAGLFGFASGGGNAQVVAGGNKMTFNGFGFQNSANSAAMNSMGNNVMFFNGSNFSGIVAIVGTN